MSAVTSLALSSIGQIAINVHDVKRATAFYRETLGLKFLFETGNLAFFDCGGIRLMLDKAERPEFDHPSSILYFNVADIKAANAQLAERGVHFEDQPHVIARLGDREIWMSFFRDSEQNLMALMSEVAISK